MGELLEPQELCGAIAKLILFTSGATPGRLDTHTLPFALARHLSVDVHLWMLSWWHHRHVSFNTVVGKGPGYSYGRWCAGASGWAPMRVL